MILSLTALYSTLRWRWHHFKSQVTHGASENTRAIVQASFSAERLLSWVSGPLIMMLVHGRRADYLKIFLWTNLSLPILPMGSRL